MLALLDHQMPERLHHSHGMLDIFCLNKLGIELTKLTGLWCVENDEISSRTNVYFVDIIDVSFANS